MSDKLTTDVVSVTRMSMQSFTKLVGTGSKSDDLRGVNRTRQHASSSVTQVRFCKTVLVPGGCNTFDHEPEQKEQMMKIF